MGSAPSNHEYRIVPQELLPQSRELLPQQQLKELEEPDDPELQPKPPQLPQPVQPTPWTWKRYESLSPRFCLVSLQWLTETVRRVIELGLAENVVLVARTGNERCQVPADCTLDQFRALWRDDPRHWYLILPKGEAAQRLEQHIEATTYERASGPTLDRILNDVLPPPPTKEK